MTNTERIICLTAVAAHLIRESRVCAYCEGAIRSGGVFLNLYDSARQYAHAKCHKDA